MRALLATFLLALALNAPAAAQAPAPPPQTETPRAEEPAALTREQAAARRAALANELSEARSRLGAAVGEPRDRIAQELALLEGLELVHERQAAALEEQVERGQVAQEADAGLAQIRSAGLPRPAPYSVREYDEALDQQEALERQADSVAIGVAAALEASAETREALAQCERLRRKAREALEASPDASARGELAAALRLRELKCRVASERLAARQVDVQNARLASRILETRRNHGAELVGRLAEGLRFTRADLDQELARISEEEDELRDELRAAKGARDAAARAWLEVRRQLAAAAPGDAALAGKARARQLAEQRRKLAVDLLGQRIQGLEERALAWQRRFAVTERSAQRAQLSDWALDASRALSEVERRIRVEQARVTELRALGRGAEPGEQRAEIEQQIGLYETSSAGLEGVRRLHERLLAQIEAQRRSVSLEDGLADGWETLRSVWDYEITAIDDRSITVSRIAVGILLLIFGYLLAGRLSRQLGRRVLPRFGFDVGAAAALESLLHYALLTLVALLALRIVNVPLTVFTLLGGAVAIGLGFGSQNVINNFISGLILFAEQPIRIGDMIEVDGTYGSVERIGARSTRIRTFTGIHMIVPNSSFLEKNVVNWTLSDDRVRTHVAVGVAYGSPVADVLRLIQEAVVGHERVLPSPEPTVLFSDFGDSALIFEVHFWLRMRTLMQRRVIESEIRSRIDELFRAAGVVIAFPQRDVHLGTAQPMQIRLVRDRNEEGRE